MRRHRNVKIVATLGPASDDYETIKALHLAGADVFRLNMSHGSHDDIEQRHNNIRKIEEELNSPIGILADLQGPWCRSAAALVLFFSLERERGRGRERFCWGPGADLLGSWCRSAALVRLW